jgi:hypothetical protein
MEHIQIPNIMLIVRTLVVWGGGKFAPFFNVSTFLILELN